ncbi:MAG: glycosyltransferase family 39 protein [Bacillota bacterium]
MKLTSHPRFMFIQHPMVWLCATIGLITGIISNARGTDLIGIFIIMIGLFAITVILYNYPDSRLRNILFVAFFLRVGLALFQAFIAPLPDSTADAVTFERIGWEAAQAWLNGGVAPKLSGAYLYSAWIGIFYYLFGRVELVPQFMNVILGVLTVFLIYKLTIEITDSKRSAQIAGLIAALFPTLNLYSAITMRENLIVVSTVFSVYCFARWLNRGTLKAMLGAAVALLVASSLHGGMIVIGAVYALFFCFYDPRRKRWVLFSAWLLVGVALIAAVFGLFGSLFINKLPSDVFLLLSPEYLDSHTTAYARDRAAYLVGLTPNSIGDLIVQTPIRMAYFLFTPFPWMVSSIIDIMGLVDAFIYIILVFYSIKGLYWLKEKNKVMFIAMILVLIIAIVTFAWGTSNYGTAIRHRQKFAWLLISMASLGIVQSNWWRWLLPVKRTSKIN